MARGSKRAFIREPEGKIRRSQMVTTYGPGAMVDLLDHAVLVGGLDFWKFSTKVGPGVAVLEEPRLRDLLDEQLRQTGRVLNVQAPFRLPPVGDDREPHPAVGVMVLEFPQWFVCQHCRALVRGSDLEEKGPKKQRHHRCDDRNRPERAVAVRFVAACRKGHLQDFPWVSFAHGWGRACDAPALRLVEGASGDFSEVVVRCVCGANRRLSEALAEEANPGCFGERPWLGFDAGEACDQKIRLLVRTASNSYFAQTVSALSIPQPPSLEDAVKSHWDMLKEVTRDALPVLIQNIPALRDAFQGWSADQVFREIEVRRSGAPRPRPALRTAEFQKFIDAAPSGPGDMPGREDAFYARSYTPSGGLPPGVGRIVLAHKLREVRTQVGFTRLEAASPNLQGEYDLGVQSAALGLHTDWLPATEIYGEGVFLQLDEAAVEAWENRPAVQERAQRLMDAYDEWMGTVRTNPPPFPGLRFYLLHSLAHLLVTAISLECGYSSSAIRERLYCAPAGDPVPMAAILLSTGTPGSEGTLGGLVDQGKRLEDHLRRACEMARLCSNDPVCARHLPDPDMPDDRQLEGAACHGCLFVAESSCERFNRYLDRALVVPTLGNPSELAYFGGVRER